MFPQLYTGASGMIASEKNLDLVTHNLANLNTPAYVPERPLFATYLDNQLRQGASDGAPPAPPQVALDASWRPTDHGPLRPTENPFDLALRGPGFFRVQSDSGELLTRAGSLSRSADGLLTTTGGLPLLDERGRQITLPEGPMAIAADGTVSVAGEQVARLGLAGAPLAQLERVGDALWKTQGQVAALDPEQAQVVQGFIEDSGVEPTTELVSMIEAQRMFEMQQRVVNLTVNTLAKHALELAGVK